MWSLVLPCCSSLPEVRRWELLDPLGIQLGFTEEGDQGFSPSMLQRQFASLARDLEWEGPFPDVIVAPPWTGDSGNGRIDGRMVASGLGDPVVVLYASSRSRAPPYSESVIRHELAHTWFYQQYGRVRGFESEAFAITVETSTPGEISLRNAADLRSMLIETGDPDVREILDLDYTGVGARSRRVDLIAWGLFQSLCLEWDFTPAETAERLVGAEAEPEMLQEALNSFCDLLRRKDSAQLLTERESRPRMRGYEIIDSLEHLWDCPPSLQIELCLEAVADLTTIERVEFIVDNLYAGLFREAVAGNDRLDELLDRLKKYPDFRDRLVKKLERALLARGDPAYFASHYGSLPGTGDPGKPEPGSWVPPLPILPLEIDATANRQILAMTRPQDAVAWIRAAVQRDDEDMTGEDLIGALADLAPPIAIAYPTPAFHDTDAVPPDLLAWAESWLAENGPLGRVSYFRILGDSRISGIATLGPLMEAVQAARR